MSARELPAPPVDAESRPFYEAAKAGRFTLRRCTACGKAHWPPRGICPFCAGATEWQDGSGRGTIYSYSVMRRTDPTYAIAYVTLEEGATMLTNIVDSELDALRIGDRVEVAFRAAKDGTPVPCFKKA